MRALAPILADFLNASHAENPLHVLRQSIRKNCSHPDDFLLEESLDEFSPSADKIRNLAQRIGNEIRGLRAGGYRELATKLNEVMQKPERIEIHPIIRAAGKTIAAAATARSLYSTIRSYPTPVLRKELDWGRGRQFAVATTKPAPTSLEEFFYQLIWDALTVEDAGIERLAICVFCGKFSAYKTRKKTHCSDRCRFKHHRLLKRSKKTAKESRRKAQSTETRKQGADQKRRDLFARFLNGNLKKTDGLEYRRILRAIDPRRKEDEARGRIVESTWYQTVKTRGRESVWNQLSPEQKKVFGSG